MATEANPADAGSVKNAIRWGLLLAAVGTVGFRLPRLVSEFRQWREALGLGDETSASGWHSALTVDLIASLFVLVVGLAVFYFLRPRTKAAK
ncbi:MAG TPA: hypothetical protein VE077_20645 [Candidatus Methylomirabilis sp.]|nr:hypothetical protein [Candidatus Methylomirabilis sp.]